MIRKFKLWNSEMTSSIDLSSNGIIVSDVSGLGNSFDNKYYDSNSSVRHLLSKKSSFENISLLINFGIKSNAYTQYNKLLKFITRNTHPNLVLEYYRNNKIVYCDVLLKKSPKTQKNEFNIIQETFLFDRLTPYYEIVKEENLQSYVINNMSDEDIKPKITLFGTDKIKLSYITTEDDTEPSETKILGVTGILTAANGELTRTDGAVGATTTKIVNGDFTEVHNTLDNAWPFNQIVDTTYKGNDVVMLPLIYKYLDGNTIKISNKKENDDWIVHPLFRNSDGTINPYILVYKYRALMDENILKSVPNVLATVNKSILTFRNHSKNMGVEYSLTDWKYLDYIQTLFQIQFATINSQKIFEGSVSKNILYKTGTLSRHKHPNMINNITKQYKFLGIEDPTGNGWEFIDGLKDFNQNTYIYYDNNQYDSSVNIENSEYYSSKDNIGGFITKLKYIETHKGLQLPNIKGGSSSTYYGDYQLSYPQSDGTAYIYTLGGFNNYAQSGLWNLYTGWTENSKDYSSQCRLMIRERL